MSDNIIAYIDMCQKEGASLQRGMNYRLGGNHSVILMSVRPNAPYKDRLEDDGTVLIYEGHDLPRSSGGIDPKSVDQPATTLTGKLTQNGQFHQAAQSYKLGKRSPERVRVYEKIRDGIWAYNGMFHLIDSWVENDGRRNVFKFRLAAVQDEGDFRVPSQFHSERRRIIPTQVKLQVWQRDGGKCVKCGAADELHFDHVVPFAKGGTSLTADNVQLLCARHNIQKRDRIE
jgi:hypothetical protein